MYMKSEKHDIIKKLTSLLKKEDKILFSFLHGSFLEGAQFNDIDIAVYIDERKIHKGDALDYEFRLSAKLEETVKLPVDVKIINYAPLGFQYHATAGKLLTCKDNEVMADKVAEIRIFYLDFKPTSEKLTMEMLGG